MQQGDVLQEEGGEGINEGGCAIFCLKRMS